MLEPPTREDLFEYQRTWAGGKAVDYSAIPAIFRRLLLEGRGI